MIRKRMLHNGTVTASRRAWCLLIFCAAAPGQRFVILGDRTGEAQPGVYEQVWRGSAAEKPEFAGSVGDSIQGLSDATAASEWAAFERLRSPYRAIPLYLAPGNHDVWSELSERLF